MRGFRPFLLAACLLASGCAAPGNTPTPRTLEQLLQGLEKYRDTYVRLTGQVDSCAGFYCHLCPVEMTPSTLDTKKCLAVDFQQFAKHGDKYMPSVGLLMDNAFRFATVTLDAYFDPMCLTGEVICGDKPSVLFGASVVEVLSRKSALDGLVTASTTYSLETPLPADESAMASELARFRPDQGGESEIRFTIPPSKPKMFLIKGLEARDGSPRTAGLACVCTFVWCEDRWPTRFFFQWESPANPFECYFLEKAAGVWRSTPIR